jgi:hypothetical protein
MALPSLLAPCPLPNRVLLVVAIAVALAATPSDTRAQQAGVGLGPSIGITNDGSATSRNPVGLGIKAWVTDRQAVTGATSFFIGDDNVRSYWILQADLLFHNFEQVSVGEGLLALYVGPGIQATILERTNNELALRGPAGVNYLFDDAPLDLFIEVAPTLQVTDPVTLRFDGAIGFRFFFDSGS